MERIKALLKTHPRGLSITNLASITGLNRNLIAKYLDMLVISGQVEIQQYGPAKVYFPSQRIPVSAMIEITSDLVMVLDQGRKIVHVNEPFARFLGLTRDRLLGKTIGEVGHPFLTKVPLSPPEGPMDPGGGEIGEVRYPDADGGSFFRIKHAPAVFEDGSVGLTLIIEDITDRRKYEENLLLSEARYRGIVQDQTEFITRYLPDTTITFVNDALCRYVNRPPEELLGKRFIEMVPEEERTQVLQGIGTLSPQNPTAVVEHRISDGRGELRWVNWTNRAIFEDGGSILEYQGMGRDVTEQREIAEKVSRYILQLEFISRKALEFVHATPQDDLYLIIAHGVKSLYPEAIVCVHSYERKNETMKVEAVLDEDARTRIRETLGRDPVGIPFRLTPEVAELAREGTLRRLPGWTYAACFPEIASEEMYSRMEEVTGPSDIYLMGLTYLKELYGEVVLIFGKGTQLQHQHLLETYLNQASVTVQRQAFLGELQRSREEYRRIVENAGEGIWALDRDYRSTFVNPRLSDILGYAPEELIGRPIEDFIPAEDIPAHRQRVAQRRSGMTGRFEQRFRRKDGSLIWTRATATPIMEEGKFSGAFAMLTDITAEKQAEDALRESEEKYRALVEQAHDFVLVVQDGVVKFCNRRAAEMWGGDIQEILGQPYENFIDPAELPRVRENYERRMAGEEVSQLYNTVLLRRDGSRIYVDLSAGTFLYEGRPADLVVLRDITEKKKAEEELGKTEAFQQALLSASPVGIGVTSNRTLVWSNDAMFRIHGYGGGELEGRKARVLYEDEGEYERVTREVSEAMESGQFRELETVWMRKDGSRAMVQLNVGPIRPGSPEVLSVAQDITERKEAEERIRSSEETFRTMVSINPLPLSLIDATGKYLHVNPAFTRLFGYTLEDIPDGEAWFTLAYPDEETRKAAIRLWKSDAAEHAAGEVRPRTFRVRCKDGSPKDILFLPASTPAGLQVVVYQDITGEKIHARLRESEDRYRHLVEDLNIGIYRSSGDPAGRFIWGNTGLVSILGYEDLADLQGVPIRELFIRPEGRMALLEELQEKRFVKNRLFSLRRKDGTPVTVSVTALAEFDEKGKLQYITGLVQEMSETIQASVQSK
ncbi:MAG TPA: PAS domain S-box protein [Methanomicrobiales archaeon]|nr:PAS domain S-box protein [Methanomicrobiales archaeon]